MTRTALLADLAAATGLSESDIEANAKWTAELMSADGITPEMLNDENMQDFALAYLAEVGRKMAAMQEQYFTRTGAAEALTGVVYELLKRRQA